jgi:CII-binding regulator of phage lambda lysogenization HflD
MAEPTGDDFRGFLRDLLTRFDRSMTAIDRRLDAQTKAMYAIQGEIRDMREAIQANTRGLLRVLDELGGSPGSA